jgi:hypothetical protein
VRRLRQTLLYPHRQLRTLGTLEPTLHRLIGFEAENGDPFFLQAGNRAQDLRADESRKLPRRLGNSRLRLAVLGDLIGKYAMRRDRGRRLHRFVGV